MKQVLDCHGRSLSSRYTRLGYCGRVLSFSIHIPPSYRLPLIVTLGYTSRFLGGAGSDGRRDEASEWRERDETRQTEGTVNDEGPRSAVWFGVLRPPHSSLNRAPSALFVRSRRVWIGETE